MTTKNKLLKNFLTGASLIAISAGSHVAMAKEFKADGGGDVIITGNGITLVTNALTVGDVQATWVNNDSFSFNGNAITLKIGNAGVGATVATIDVTTPEVAFVPIPIVNAEIKANSSINSVVNSAGDTKLDIIVDDNINLFLRGNKAGVDNNGIAVPAGTFTHLNEVKLNNTSRVDFTDDINAANTTVRGNAALDAQGFSADGILVALDNLTLKSAIVNDLTGAGNNAKTVTVNEDSFIKTLELQNGSKFKANKKLYVKNVEFSNATQDQLLIENIFTYYLEADKFFKGSNVVFNNAAASAVIFQPLAKDLTLNLTSNLAFKTLNSAGGNVGINNNVAGELFTARGAGSFGTAANKLTNFLTYW